VDQREAVTEDVEIAAGRWRAVVTTTGATLRQLTHDAEDVVDGFGPGEQPTAARGQVLAPWTNRLRDGRYEFAGGVHLLAITDPATTTALHGLVAGVSWTVARREPTRVTLEHRLASTPGYPWELFLAVTYALDDDGLRVVHEATNASPSPAPYAVGAHPYLVAGPGPVDDWVVILDASEVMLVDEQRMLPTDVVDVAAAGLDLRRPRQVGPLRLNHAYTGLGRDGDGRVGVTVRGAGDGDAVVLWGGEGCRWIQLYTGDHDPVAPRRSIAVEPMSAPADAFNSGRDLVVLAAAGEDGASHRLEWGIARAVRSGRRPDGGTARRATSG
jgi:aldose 1-epimerase